MPHSLRVKIKNLRYKGIITDKDCDRLITALDNKDALDKIRAEIEERKLNSGGEPNRELAFNVCLQIIDKYTAESEEQNADSD